MADRLYIGSKYKELSDSLYNKKVLYGEKTDIFMLAFAFGVHEGVRTPLKPKTALVNKNWTEKIKICTTRIKNETIQA